MATFPWEAAGGFLGDVLGFVGAQQSLAAQGAQAAQANRLNWEQLGRQNDFYQQSKDQAYHFKDRDELLAREMFDKSAALQREFAQSGVKWRVADAAAAGVHPLFALGAGGASFQSPAISVGGGGVPSAGPVGLLEGPSSYGGGSGAFLQSMGQNVGRALAATMAREERDAELMKGLQYERAMLENQLLAAQIAKMTAPGTGPGIPATSGPGGVGSYNPKKPDVLNRQPTQPASEAGPAQPFQRFVHTSTGLMAMPSQNVQMDDMGSPGYFKFMVDNRIAPFFGYESAAPPQAVVQARWPKATGVEYNSAAMEWQPIFSGEPWPKRWERWIRRNVPGAADPNWGLHVPWKPR